MKTEHPILKVPEPLQMDAQKPAEADVASARKITRETRIPMSVPRMKLEVPSVEGRHMHWFSETNVPAALQAGYERVKRSEALLSGAAIGGDPDLGGNTDLGDGVSLLGSIEGPQGKHEYAILMWIPIQWWNDDRKVLEQKNSQIMESIFGPEARQAGAEGKSQSLGDNQYRGRALFQRATRKAKIATRR